MNYLLQLLAAFVFGYLCDAGIWLLRNVVVESYLMKMVFCLLTVLITAVGILSPDIRSILTVRSESEVNGENSLSIIASLSFIYVKGRSI